MSSFGGNARKALPVLHASDVPKQMGHMHVVYGPGGGGKTTFASTLYDYPPTSDCIFIQPDVAGISSISHRSNLNWIPIHKYVEVVDYFESVYENPPCRAYVLDHLTKLLYMVMFDKFGPPPWDWKLYSGPTGQIKALMENLNTMAEQHNMIIVVIAHDSWQQDETSEGSDKRFELNMSGGFAKALLPIPAFITHLVELDDARKTRKLVVQGKRTYAKKRVAPGTVAATIPDEIYNPSFVPILETLWEGKPFPVEKHKKPIPGQRGGDNNERVNSEQRVLS